MCITPVKIQTEDGFKMVRCRKCRDCISERKMHWIGRMNAEHKTCQSAWFCTFTYGKSVCPETGREIPASENPNAYMLNYPDLQKCFKRMRKAGHKFSYLAVGEYGSEKSRAHFHAVIFWKSAPPDRQLDVRLDDCSFWDLGFVQYEKPKSTKAAATYMMEYLDKDNIHRNALRFSKRPALGEEYCLEYAKRHARRGLSLFQRGPAFTVDGNDNRDGKPFFYRVERDSSLYTKMLDAWLLEWARRRPDERLILSEDASEYLSDIAQNPDREPVDVQTYLEKMYGIEVVPDLHKPHTVYTLTDAMVLSTFRNQVIINNTKGEVIWQDALDDLVDPLDPNDQEAFRAAWPKMRDIALTRFPDRVLSHLECWPNLVWPTSDLIASERSRRLRQKPSQTYVGRPNPSLEKRPRSSPP